MTGPYTTVMSVLLLVVLVAGLTAPASAWAGARFSGGVWWVYGYIDESDFAAPAFSDALDAETGGNFSDPAMVVYADDGDSYGRWHFSAEARLGRGSFTDPRHNASGDFVGIHEAWIGYDFHNGLILRVGKHQVPFGWKTANFWPGDLLQGGYGDQMDPGFKLSDQQGAFRYDLAYYHQDDWGEDSTDTMDDNGHWGGSDTWRKIKTGVVNLDWTPDEVNTLGVSWQSGRMQDLVPLTNDNPAASNDNGRHNALDLHYLYEGRRFTGKYRYIRARRDFSGMDAFMKSSAPPRSHALPVDDEVETERHVVHLGWKHNRWRYVLEASTASSDTEGNPADRVRAWTPGVRYNYGPGWLYLEYLSQNGDIDRNGDVYEADFRSVYVAMDFYF